MIQELRLESVPGYGTAPRGMARDGQAWSGEARQGAGVLPPANKTGGLGWNCI